MIATIFYLAFWFASTNSTNDVLPPYASRIVGDTAFRVPGRINCAQYSTDGTLLYVGINQAPQLGEIDVLNAKSGKIVDRFRTPFIDVTDICSTPNHDYLIYINNGALCYHDRRLDKPDWHFGQHFFRAVWLTKKATILANDDGILKLIDPKKPAAAKPLNESLAKVHWLEVNAQQTVTAVVTHEQNIVLINLETGKELTQFPSPTTNSRELLFSADGSLLFVSGYSDSVSCFQTKDGKKRWTTKIKKDIRQRFRFALSPDQQQLICFHQDGCVVDVTTGKKLSDRSIPQYAKIEAISPDGRHCLIHTDDQLIRSMDIATGQLTPNIATRVLSPKAIAVTRDGKTVYTANESGLTRYNIPQQHSDLLSQKGSEQLIISDDDALYSIDQMGQVFHWDTNKRDWHIIQEYQGDSNKPFKPIAQLSSISLVVDTHGDIVFVDRTTNRLHLRAFDVGGQTFRSNWRIGEQFAISPDGTKLVVASSTADIPSFSWWDPIKGKEYQPKTMGNRPPIMTAENGSRIVGELKLEDHPIVPLRWLPNGREILGQSRLGFVIADANDMSLRRVVCRWKDLNHEPTIAAAWFVENDYPYAVSPNGRLLAVPNRDMVMLYDLHTGEPRRFFMVGDTAKTLQFTQDGQQLLIAGRYPWMVMWNVYEPDKTTINADWTNGFRIHQEICQSIQDPKLVLDLAQKIPTPALPDLKRLANQLTDLDSPQFATREKAEKYLSSLSGDHVRAVEQFMKSPTRSLESRERCERIIKKLRKAPLTQETIQQLRLLEVFEQINHPVARETLQRLATGHEEHLLTVEAKLSMERLKRMNRPR